MRSLRELAVAPRVRDDCERQLAPPREARAQRLDQGVNFVRRSGIAELGANQSRALAGSHQPADHGGVGRRARAQPAHLLGVRGPLRDERAQPQRAVLDDDLPAGRE